MVPTPNTAVHRAPIMISDVVCDRLYVHLRQCSHRPVWAGHGCRDIGSDSQKVSLQCTYAENTTGGGPPAPGAYTRPPNVYPARDGDDDDGSGLDLTVAIAAGIAFVVMGLIYGYYRWTRSNSAPISTCKELDIAVHPERTRISHAPLVTPGIALSPICNRALPTTAPSTPERTAWLTRSRSLPRRRRGSQRASR